MTDIKTVALFDLSRTLASQQLAQTLYPFEALAYIKEWILSIGKQLDPARFVQNAPDVWIAKSARISSAALIAGPCLIDEDTEVRHGAFIRGNVLVGKGAVVGNSTELKNVILFDGVQVPHYNYVGDSILGYRAHMGAGAITSNVKGDKSCIVIRNGTECIETHRKKVGAFLGDFAEIGCGCVLNPGTVIGVGTQVYPLISVRGVLPPDCICKDTDTVIKRK